MSRNITATNIKIVKALVFIALLVIVYFLFFVPVITKYSENYTSVAKFESRGESIEVPTFSVCTGWKKSLMKKYQISNWFLITPPNTSNIPSNYTIRSLFDDLTYKLNKDFVIGIRIGWFFKLTTLHIGINDIMEGKNAYKFEVKESVWTMDHGQCYIIIPDQVFLRPYEDYLSLSIAKNNTPDNDELRKIKIQISSKDTFNTLITDASGSENNILEYETSNDKSLNIVYTEVNTNFIKDCNELPFFKCWAKEILIRRNKKCTKKCVPLMPDSVMDTIPHNLSKCPTDADDYCNFGIEESRNILKLKSYCLKPCKNKGSILDIKENDIGPLHPLGSEQVHIFFSVSTKIITYNEYYAYDAAGMFGSIGGSLGLFIGFSLFDTFCLLLDFLLKKLKLT